MASPNFLSRLPSVPKIVLDLLLASLEALEVSYTIVASMDSMKSISEYRTISNRSLDPKAPNSQISQHLYKSGSISYRCDYTVICSRDSINA